MSPVHHALSIVVILSICVPASAQEQRRRRAPPPNPYEAVAANPYEGAPATPARTEAEAAPRAEAEPAPRVEPAVVDEAEDDAPPVLADDRPLDELARVATQVAAPPPPHEAMRDLDDVLSGNASDPIAGVDDAPTPADRVGVPTRAETAAAIERVTPELRACASDRASGVVELRIVFLSNGRVTTAHVQNRSARLSPRERSCIARAARRAQIASFERARFEVTYPIRLS